MCIATAATLAVALVLIWPSGAAAHYDGPGGDVARYEVTLKQIEFVLVRHYRKASREHADRAEIARLERAGVFVSTRVQADGHVAQNTVLGLFSLHFTGADSHQPKAIVTLKHPPLVYDHPDCTSAEPVGAEAYSSLIEGAGLRRDVESLLGSYPAPVDEWSGGSGFDSSVEQALNPPISQGTAVIGAAGELRPEDPHAVIPPYNDLTGHLNDNLAPHGGSNTLAVVVHYVFDYKYLATSQPCSGVTGATGGSAGGSGTGGGTPGTGGTGGTDAGPPVIEEPGSSPDYDDSGALAARFQVTLKRVQVVLARNHLPLDRHELNKDEAVLARLEAGKLFVHTLVTAAGHDTQETFLGLYPLHFIQTGGIAPSAVITLHNRLVYSHLDCTPAEPVSAIANSSVLNRSAQSAGSSLAANSGPFDRHTVASNTQAAAAGLDMPTPPGAGLPGASGQLSATQFTDLTGDLNLHNGSHGLHGANFEKLVVHYVFDYAYIVTADTCAGQSGGTTGSPTSTQPMPPASTTNSADGATCSGSKQVCTGNGAHCNMGATCNTGINQTCTDSGTHCDGAGGDCRNSSACTGTGNQCDTGGTCGGSNGVCFSGGTCNGSTSQCPVAGGVCTGSQSECDQTAHCTGPMDTCKTGSECDGTGSTCDGSGTTCGVNATGSMCTNMASCEATNDTCHTASTCSGGAANHCYDTGTLCTSGALDNTCTMGSRCTKPPPTAPMPPCPAPGSSEGLILDTFIPDGVNPLPPSVTDQNGTSIPQSGYMNVCPGTSTSVTWNYADHPEITGTDPIDNSPIPPGRHVYRVTITLANPNGGGNPTGGPTITNAIGRAFWNTGP